MNIENLNQAFIEIAEKKSRLSLLKEENQVYESLKNEILDLEDSFQNLYGRFLEDVLFNVYDEFCPDNELMPLKSYFAEFYQVGKNGPHQQFDVYPETGVIVDADDFPGIKARLVLVPNPTRLILQGEKESFKEVVWSMDPVLES